MPYIKVLYEAIKLKALLPSSDMKYYRVGRLSNDEINLIKKYFNQKKVNSTGVNVFTRAFICFLKSKDEAKCFLNCHLKKNMNKVLYTLEQDRNLDYNSVSYMDMHDISFYGNEEEVLFFPFSSFEIREIKEKTYNQEKIYEIDLLYLGSNVNNIDNKNKKSVDDFQIIKNWDDKSQIDELKK